MPTEDRKTEGTRMPASPLEAETRCAPVGVWGREN
jgi:hypothetical protein